MVRYVYYRCSKKFGVCNQKYISEINLAKQLRRKIKSIFVPDQWKEKWLSLLEQDKITESVKAKENTALTETELQATETKLNKLLNAYLESIISEEDYKVKKNELFNIKLQLQEKIEEIKQHGNNWLEPLEHFIMSAFQAQKIAQEKNDFESLSTFVRSACSNFFLTDQHLQFSYNLGYSTLFSVCGSPHPATYCSEKSSCVNSHYFIPNDSIVQFVEIIKSWKLMFGDVLPNYNLAN